MHAVGASYTPAVCRITGAKCSIRSRLSARRSLRKSKMISLTPSLAKVATSSAICPAGPEKGRRSLPWPSSDWLGS